MIEGEIEVFGEYGCPRCKELKSLLYLDDIPFKYIDVATNIGKVEAAQRGVLREELPVVFKNGHQCLSHEPSVIMITLAHWGE